MQVILEGKSSSMLIDDPDRLRNAAKEHGNKAESAVDFFEVYFQGKGKSDSGRHHWSSSRSWGGVFPHGELG